MGKIMHFQNWRQSQQTRPFEEGVPNFAAIFLVIFTGSFRWRFSVLLMADFLALLLRSGTEAYVDYDTPFEGAITKVHF